MCILDELKIYKKPKPNNKGEIGFGVAVEYKNDVFYYRYAGKYLPEKKVSYMTAEGSYFGRVSGEKDRIIVVPKGDIVVVLEYVPSGFAFMKEMKKYKNKSVDEAINIALDLKEERNKFIEEQQKIRKTLKL